MLIAMLRQMRLLRTALAIRSPALDDLTLGLTALQPQGASFDVALSQACGVIKTRRVSEG